MTVFVVRCPVKGCLLGRVFRRGDPRASVRYVWLGVTWTGRGTTGLLNWAWDGGRGSKHFMVMGCTHGTRNVEFGLLLGMMEALDFPCQSDRRIGFTTTRSPSGAGTRIERSSCPTRTGRRGRDLSVRAATVESTTVDRPLELHRTCRVLGV